MDDQEVDREGNRMSEGTTRWRVRFSIKLLLLVMAVVSAYLAGRWGGYQAGRESVLSEQWQTSPALYDPKHPERW
jgi:hypothetical protein